MWASHEMIPRSLVLPMFDAVSSPVLEWQVTAPTAHIPSPLWPAAAPTSDTIPGLKGTILQFYPNTKFTTKLTTSDCVGVLHFPLRPRICQFIYVVLVGSWNVLCLCCIFSSLVVFWLLYACFHQILCDIVLFIIDRWLLPTLEKMCLFTRQALQQVLMGIGEARQQECVPVPG